MTKAAEAEHTATFYNRTRRSASIPKSLIRRGRLLDLPIYYVLRMSDLAREGLEHSGSHRFADHIYRSEPSGRGIVGRWLDGRLLALPAVRSFRHRYLAARNELSLFLIDRLKQPGDRPVHVLSVPCGIPRELADAADLVRWRLGALPDRLVFHGYDLDREVLDEAIRFARDRGLRTFRAHHGDALDRAAYLQSFDYITCTGLAEFLDDRQLAELYGIFFEILDNGGRLFTSAMQRRRLSEYLLQIAEIRTYYRGADDIHRLIEPVGFADVRTRRDELQLQTIVVATK